MTALLEAFPASRPAAPRPLTATHRSGGTVLVLPQQRGASFGDLLVQLPLLHALPSCLGADRLVLLAPHPIALLGQELGLADRVHVVADDDRARLRALVAEEDPSWAISLRGSSLPSSLLLRRCPRAQRIGWRSLANRLLLHHTVPRHRDRYYPLVFGRILTPFGGAVDPIATMARIARPHPADVLAPGRRRLLCIPSGKLAVKNWGVERFFALAEHLAARVAGLEAMAVLGPREDDLAQRFAAAGWAVRCGGQAGPARLAALCRTAACVVSHDCGPGHIAQMSGAPTVVLFPNYRGDGHRERMLRLWWWQRAGCRAITTLGVRPLGELPVAVVGEEVEAALTDASSCDDALWWDAAGDHPSTGAGPPRSP